MAELAGRDLAAVYDVRALRAGELELEYDVGDAVDRLELLGYTVEPFEHGLHLAGEQPRLGYHVTGRGLDVRARDAAVLAELVERVEDVPAPPPPAGDPAEREVERTLHDRVEDALAQLAAAHAGWSNLTPAQRDAALRLTVRVVVALGRLQLRHFDTAD